MKGLHSIDGSSLIPTAISTATNFILSGLLGTLIFGEEVNFLWLVGLSMLLIGMYMIISSGKSTEKDTKLS